MAFHSQIETIYQRFYQTPSTRYTDWTWNDVLARVERNRRAVTSDERFATADNQDFLQYRAEYQTWCDLCKLMSFSRSGPWLTR